MVTVTVKVDTSKLTNLNEQIPKIKEKGLSLASQYMINRLQKNSPVDHGVLKGWFAYEYSEGEEVKIKSPAEYVQFVNDGTGIYGPYHTPIYSKHIGSPMAFQVGGQMVYTRMIRGQKPQKFVERSIAEVEGKLGNLFIKAVREVLQ